jgi:hypothetical protein
MEDVKLLGGSKSPNWYSAVSVHSSSATTAALRERTSQRLGAYQSAPTGSEDGALLDMEKGLAPPPMNQVELPYSPHVRTAQLAKPTADGRRGKMKPAAMPAAKDMKKRYELWRGRNVFLCGGVRCESSWDAPRGVYRDE